MLLATKSSRYQPRSSVLPVLLQPAPETLGERCRNISTTTGYARANLGLRQSLESGDHERAADPVPPDSGRDLFTAAYRNLHVAAHHQIFPPMPDRHSAA